MEQFQGGTAYQVYSPQGSKPLESLKIVGPVRKEYDKLSKSQVIVVEQPTSRITVPKVLTGALLVHPVIVVQIFALNITAINIEFCVVDALGKRRLIFSNSFTAIQAHPQHTKFPFQMLPRNVWMDVVFDVRSIHRAVYETRAPVGFRGVESVSLSGAGCKVRRIYSLRDTPASFSNHAAYHVDVPAQFALPGDVEQQHVLVQRGDELVSSETSAASCLAAPAAAAAAAAVAGGRNPAVVPQTAKASKPTRLRSAPARDTGAAVLAQHDHQGSTAGYGTSTSASASVTAAASVVPTRRHVSSASHLRPKVGHVSAHGQPVQHQLQQQYVDASLVGQDIMATSLCHDVDEHRSLRETLPRSATTRTCASSGVLRASGAAERSLAARAQHLLPVAEHLCAAEEADFVHLPTTIDVARGTEPCEQRPLEAAPRVEPVSEDEDAEFVVRHYSPPQFAGCPVPANRDLGADSLPNATHSDQHNDTFVTTSVAREPSQICEPPSVESSRRQHKSQKKSVLSDSTRPLPPQMASTTSVASVDQTALFDAEREANTARQLRLSSSVVLLEKASVDTDHHAALGHRPLRADPTEVCESSAVFFRLRADLHAPSPAAERRYECVSDDDEQQPSTDDRAFFFPSAEGGDRQRPLSPDVAQRMSSTGPCVLPATEVNVGTYAPLNPAQLDLAEAEHVAPNEYVPSKSDDLASRPRDRPSSRWLEGVPSPPPPVRMSHELGCSPPEHLLADKSRYEYDPVVGCYFDRVSNRFVKPPGAQPLSLPGSAPYGTGRRPSPATAAERGCSPGQPFRQRQVL